MSLEIYLNTFSEFENEFEQNEIDELPDYSLYSNGIKICEKYINRFVAEVSNCQFSCDGEEIYFFKYIVPQITSKLIIYHELENIECYRGEIESEMETSMLRKRLDIYINYINTHKDFYLYYKRKDHSYDIQYFLRKNDLARRHKIDDLLQGGFITCNSKVLAHFMAYDKLMITINGMIRDVNDLEEGIDLENSLNKLLAALSWSSTKANFIELIYALHALKVFNGGNISIKELVEIFGKLLGVDIDNYSRVYWELRDRKKSKTPFIDKLKSCLLNKINNEFDNLDEYGKDNSSNQSKGRSR